MFAGVMIFVFGMAVGAAINRKYNKLGDKNDG
jgi:hypothetical protein